MKEPRGPLNKSRGPLKGSRQPTEKQNSKIRVILANIGMWPRNKSQRKCENQSLLTILQVMRPPGGPDADVYRSSWPLAARRQMFTNPAYHSSTRPDLILAARSGAKINRPNFELTCQLRKNLPPSRKWQAGFTSLRLPRATPKMQNLQKRSKFEFLTALLAPL